MLCDAQQVYLRIAMLTPKSAGRFFEDLLRAQGENPNAVMQTMHLKRFLDEGLHQQQAAFQAEQQAHADKAAVQDAFRTTVRSKLATGKLERVKQLEHDEAVHAAIMKRKVS